MATLLTARDLSKSFGSQTLFTGVAMQLVEGDRLGLIGPNGAGKSTLLKILSGLEDPDEGDVSRKRSLRCVYVRQHDDFAPEATALSAVVDQLDQQVASGHRLDAETRASITLSQLGFVEFDQPVGTMSGGWRKRLSIACALTHEPEVLLLDEPTNHLDLEGVVWLERFVQQANMAVVIITHDRRFLENVARRIIELSPAYPGGTFEATGNYTMFVRRKGEFLDAQAVAQSSLANRVRRDTAWLQQGIQGRQTRNKTQIQDSTQRRADLKNIRTRNEAPSKRTTIDFQATDRKTKRLLTLNGVSKSMGGRKLFESLDLTLSPGRRIGLLGENGSGKTTLLKIISGEMEPDSGTRKPADNLRIVTFTQDRAELDPAETLQEALCPVGDTVDYRGKPMHISGWARKFLFDPDQLRTFVSNLSGGERARVLIARLMLEPADILLLDEPTNDLDIPSLEVLEQAVLEFPGATMLVTHDRFMLERLSTEFLALDGSGNVTSHASFQQWQQRDSANREERAREQKRKRPTPGNKREPASAKPKKLTFKLQRECDGMEQAILTAESEVAELELQVADATIMTDHVQHTRLYSQLTAAQQRVQQLYNRWAELEAMQRG